MLCPNCGTKTTNAHKFCRNCGMNLGPVSQAVSAHLSHGGASAAAAAAAREASRRGTRRMAKGLFAGVFVFLLGMLMLRFLPGTAFKAVGAVITLLGVMFSLVTVLSSMRADATAEASPAPPRHVPEGAAATGRLLHENTVEPLPASVTDHTTELLGVEVIDRGERK
ncbi:MAG TPA: hypothetical protein VGB98_04405 [Pyrinomonadaceae bacterium]|jgi:predicted lipid-binding transport protein (Tim44 family)